MVDYILFGELIQEVEDCVAHFGQLISEFDVCFAFYCEANLVLRQECVQLLQIADGFVGEQVHAVQEVGFEHPDKCQEVAEVVPHVFVAI